MNPVRLSTALMNVLGIARLSSIPFGSGTRREAKLHAAKMQSWSEHWDSIRSAHDDRLHAAAHEWDQAPQPTPFWRY